MDNIFQKSKFGSTLGTIGVLGGIFYAMKNNKGLGATSLYAIGFGVVGVIIGNSITNFYE